VPVLTLRALLRELVELVQRARTAAWVSLRLELNMSCLSRNWRKRSSV